MEDHSEQKEKDRPWEVGLVKCVICEHVWVAMRPEGTDELTCPACSHSGPFLVQIEDDTYEEDESDE